MDETICFRPIAEVAELVRTRQVSPLEVTRVILDRIAQIASKLNCYLTILTDKALARAEEMERLLGRGVYLGPLHGIPISLKDNIATAGIRTTAGSVILADWVPESTAVVAQRLEAAGSVLVAKAHLYEFANGVYHPQYGPVRNPWNLERSCGGSSSGSASAIVAGLCYGSIGTDTGGSIRIPAAFCGIVGLKPTYGRVSRRGVIPYSSMLDHVGPMARTVQDTAILLQAIAGHDPHDHTTTKLPVPDFSQVLEDGARGLRLRAAKLGSSDPIDTEVENAVRDAYAVLEQEGAIITETRLPDLAQARQIMETISSVEAADYHRPYLRTRALEYHPVWRSLLETAEFIPATEYVYAQRLRMQMIEELNSALEGSHGLLLPALPIPAYRIGERTVEVGGCTEDVVKLRIHYNALFNLTGHPAMVLPCGFSRNGLPVGLQIIGHPFDEATVLRIARSYERVTEWHLKRPPI